MLSKPSLAAWAEDKKSEYLSSREGSKNTGSVEVGVIQQSKETVTQIAGHVSQFVRALVEEEEDGWARDSFTLSFEAFAPMGRRPVC